ncbi:MAG: universal stress protein [Deltaproteobacteria bacterium]|nr:universal stress protein [Deltaproteobacteria bacterium]
MYKNILVPLDQSPLAEEGIESAITLAKAFDSTIHLLYAFEIIPLLKRDKEAEYRTLKGEGETYLSELKERISQFGVSVNTVVVPGDPGLVICDYAEKEDMDIILLSARGRGEIERWALGSVSDKVMRHSPKPVLLVKSASRDLLRGRTILVVDDEADVLDAIEEVLDMCIIDKADNHGTAVECLKNNRYDLAILDIMGVDGFDLLKRTASKGIPTVMLTAHAVTEESLSRSARLGAVSFLPKEKMYELESFLIDVIRSSGKPVWKKLFDRLSPYFRMNFGWSEKEEAKLREKIEAIGKE